jgi:tetratricopeptide (TPR) repeat protein
MLPASRRAAKAALALSLSALALALQGCPHRVPGPTELLDQAATWADASPRSSALAGFHASLVKGDPAEAALRFQRALERDPAEPYALAGMMLLERRRGHPERSLSYALDLCERAPRHPLAAAGARLALDMAGVAAPLDEEILRRGERALAAGLDADAAHLLRAAIAYVHGTRGEDDRQQQAFAEMGVPDQYAVWGPFSAFQWLDFEAVLPPEKDGALVGPFQGPHGTLEPRRFRFRDARFDLEGDTGHGDVYLAAVDLEVKASAVHTVRMVSSGSYRVYLDGERLLERRGFARALPTVAQEAVLLEPGRHRLLVKVVREDRAVSFSLALPRADGKPAALQFLEAKGPAPQWSGVKRVPPERAFPSAEALAAALTPEVGSALARYLAIRDGMGRDRDGAKALMLELEQEISGPALTSLRADLALGDRTIPQKVARGRATRDLEATLEKDPADVQALLTRAQVALDDGRGLEAAELVKRARAAAGADSPGYPVPVAEARVNLALGVDAQADNSAVAALQAQPGLCEALGVRYDLARRRDAVALSDGLVKSMERCPGARTRSAEHARMRGDLAAAVSLYEQMARRDPAQISASVTLANLLVALRRFEEADALLRALAGQWPRNDSLLKRLADVNELWGRPKEALELRERALALDGSDLTLRRSVSRAKEGAEPLQEHAIDGKAAIAAYVAAPGQEDTTHAYVLDAAATRVYPDGSMVDRIHIIQKALDQNGVPQIAEVSIPAGAQVLALRTVKADGTVLEPESIEGKETVSLPGVQVGDFVEYEYLLAHGARGPSQPGFTASNFYFRIAGAPNNRATYTVIAPKGAGMGADPHNLQLPADVIRVQGDQEVFFHEERRVTPLVPEPGAPPSPTEYIPFVSVGAGAQGNEGLVAAYADSAVERGQLTVEVEAFARNSAGGKKGTEAARAIYAAVMERLSGRDSGLSQSAAASLAQNRGSRLWLMKASLEAVGIPARVAAIRTFSADPAEYRYPTEALLPYVALHVEPPGEAPFWLDTALRFGPFGELPEQAAGGREAWLFPEPGRPGRMVKTAAQPLRPPKRVELKLQLGADGALSGSGDEIYSGREAAQLAEALEQLPPDQRDQALQSALSRYFGGAELSGLRLDLKREVGASATIHYEFRVPRFGRVEGDRRMTLPPLTFPAYLGRRFIQLGSRRTPLFVDETELTTTRAEVKLPAGFALQDPLGKLELPTTHGGFLRTEKQEGDVLTIEETYRVDMARIAPGDYEELARFAGEVDLVQSRDLELVRP